jgi:probable rRNA maturation factor
MRELNRRFGGKDHITDVLAFDMTDGSEPGFVGEVYVNLQQARRQAEENSVPYIQEVRRLTVHGILHLLGYRDRVGRERNLMWSRQEEYL